MAAPTPLHELHSWARGVLAAEAKLDRPRGAVHIMDREGDNYDLLSHMQHESIRHIVRLAHNRNLVGTTWRIPSFRSLFLRHDAFGVNP